MFLFCAFALQALFLIGWFLNDNCHSAFSTAQDSTCMFSFLHCVTVHCAQNCSITFLHGQFIFPSQNGNKFAMQQEEQFWDRSTTHWQTNCLMMKVSHAGHAVVFLCWFSFLSHLIWWFIFWSTFVFKKIGIIQSEEKTCNLSEMLHGMLCHFVHISFVWFLSESWNDQLWLLTEKHRWQQEQNILQSVTCEMRRGFCWSNACFCFACCWKNWWTDACNFWMSAHPRMVQT